MRLETSPYKPDFIRVAPGVAGIVWHTRKNLKKSFLPCVAGSKKSPGVTKPGIKAIHKVVTKKAAKTNDCNIMFDYKDSVSLDKLAQPGKVNSEDAKNQPEEGKKTLQKRAHAKYVTNGIANKLRKLDSDLNKSYLNTFFCSSILQQTDQKITGKYCNNRWCLVCNRIRTAKLITGYKDVLNELEDKQFVTLTIPNVPGDQLRQSIKSLIGEFISIKCMFKKRKTPLIGIRKLEATYNPIRDDYHPHFHLVVSGYQVSYDLVSEWLKRFPEANLDAQDIRPADENAVMELFKYFTKIVTKRAVYASPLDVIFNAMYKLRVFQPMGIKKDVSEDVEKIRAEIYQDLEAREVTWSWMESDWIDKETGECLTGYKPSERTKELLNPKIQQSPCKKLAVF